MNGPGGGQQNELQKALSLHKANQFGPAKDMFLEILKSDPRNAYILYLLGETCSQMGDFTESLGWLDKAANLSPEQPGIYYNRGHALSCLGRYSEAIISYDKVLALMPDNADAHLNRGAALMALKRYKDALISFDQALRIDPDYFEAMGNRGLVLSRLGRYVEANEAFAAALKLEPEDMNIKAALTVSRAYAGDWRDRARLLSEVADALTSGQVVMDAFESLALYDDPRLHRRCAEIRTARARLAMPKPASPAPGKIWPEKIRVGYLSSDFHKHPTAYLMAEVFERHDRDRFEVVAFSTGPKTGDAMQVRLRAAFDAFHEASALSDGDLAQTIAAQDIEILIDLKGFTAMGRTSALALRPAPVQVNFLGYPGTLGADYIDYIIGDPVVTPEGVDDFYTEKIVRLPHTYQPNSLRPVAAPTSKDMCGLPAEGVVFCSFNNSYKITPETFSSWMRILQAVPGSVLWLMAMNGAEGNLRREAVVRGVRPERLVFAESLDWPQHLARLACADIALDTAPYGSHTTASDALWAGVPLITCMGASFASRVAASCIAAAGMPELIRTSPEAGEAFAIRLAQDPQTYAGYKSRLLELRGKSLLFDSLSFTKNLEAAFVAMSDKSRRGAEAVSFNVSAPFNLP